jgi:hypothetical protein
MAETLTLQQVSEKLLKVEKALGSLYNLNSPEAMDKIKTLKVIKESLINKKAILLQESNVMVTTKSGDTTVIPSSDKSSIDALKKDSNVASIEDTSGTKIKEAEESDVALNMDYVGKVLTGLFTDFLRDIGEEISSVDYNSISKDEIEVKIEFKEGTNKSYKFKIEADKLFIDGNYLIDLSRLPSGEVQIPQETLSSSLYKHFEGELEFNDMDVNEELLDEASWKQIVLGLGLTAATIAGIGKAFLPPSAEELRDKETLQKVVNLQKEALERTSDGDVLKMVRSLEGFLNTTYIQFSAQQADRMGSEKMSSLINQEARTIIEKLIQTGNENVKAGFLVKADGTMTWVNPTKISPVNEGIVTDVKGNILHVGDKIKVGNIIFEINFDSKENLVYLESRGKKYLGGSKEFRAILEGSTLHIDDSNFITEMVEVGDRVKISKSYGGSRGTVVDKKDSFITLEGGESYPESEVVNVSRKLGQDIDVGHVDDEPGMLSQTAYETAVHAANIYKQLKAYERLNTEVDFPNWWQSKVILAKDYISKADSWLEFTTRERNFMEEEKNTKES